MKGKIKYLVAIIITLFICFYEFPYYIDAPGDLDNLNEKIKIENGYKSKGSINLTYVTEVKGTLPMLLYAKINPYWEIHAKKESNIGTLDYDSLMAREKILMKQSYTSAIKFAYEAAKKEVNIEEEKCYVIYVYEEAKNELKVGDRIKSIDGNEFKTCLEISNYIKSKSENDESKIVVKKDNKEYVRNAKYIKLNENSIGLGIQLGVEYVLTTNPKYKFEFNKNEYGPSGGLMIALAVYNSLVEEDITGGYKIAGTGTLDGYGNVGEIGGIEFKLKGAEKNKAKVFFAPSGDNYNDAVKFKEKNKYKIEIVEVKTFNDALEYLKKNFVNN